MEKFAEEPPTVWDRHSATWRLRKARPIAERVESLGYQIRCSRRDVVVELSMTSDRDIARFLAAMRDLGCAFYDSPKGIAPVAAVRHFKRAGLLVGDFSELVYTPTGGWRIKLI